MHRLLVTYFYKRIGKFDVNDGLDTECIDDEFVNLLIESIYHQTSQITAHLMIQRCKFVLELN